MALPGMQAPTAEWHGAVSGKFTDKLHGREACRRQVDAPAKHGADHSLSRNGFGAYFTDTAGLHGNEGRRLVPHLQASQVYDWKPSRRALSEPGAAHYEKPEGRRIPEGLPNQVVYTMREKRHLRQVESKEEYHDRPVGPRTVVRDNGLRAADQPASEVDISTEMTRKARILDLRSQRNGINCKSLGDKPYRHPEYEKGFHVGGSLIVGSSFTRGHFKKTEPRNSTSVQLVMDGPKKSTKSYEEKMREKQLQEAQAEVLHLTRSWEVDALKDCEEAGYEDPDSDDEVVRQGG